MGKAGVGKVRPAGAGTARPITDFIYGRGRSLRILSSFAVLGAAIARPGAGQDFTEMRMREGVEAYQSGRPSDAVNPLRVAVFGYLDRPPQLCRALVYLALAHDASGRQAEALSAANRLRDVQRRAATCAEAPLDERVRAEFESRLGRPLFSEGGAAALAGRAEPAPRSPARDPAPGPATAPAGVATAAASSEDPVPAADLDAPPRIKTRVAAVYPRAAREANIAGTVVLRVLVSETGRAERVETIKGIRPLAEAAMASVRRWTFEPARRAGRDVSAWLVVEIPFQR